MIALVALVLGAAIWSDALPAAEEKPHEPIVPPEPLAPPESLAPPPPNQSEPKQPSKETTATPRTGHCPRCGYLAVSNWRYCPSCGWDHQALAGVVAGERLENIRQAAVGLVVVKNKLGIEDILSPNQLSKLRRYYRVSGGLGQVKIFGTAFPFGEDGLYVTSARVLHRGIEVQLRNYRNHFIDARIVGYDLPSGIGVVRADQAKQSALKPSGRVMDEEELSWIVCYPVSADRDVVRYLPASIHSGHLVDRGYFGTQLVSFENLLRTDHTLPDGCIGGLLLDSLGASAGVVLGSPDTGITYARPLNDIAPMIETLARGDRVERSYYGLGLVSPDERHRTRFDLPPDTWRPVVAYLIHGSPAEAAGVRRGDLLMAIDGEAIEDFVDVGTRLLSRQPGGVRTTLTLRRGSESIEIAIAPGRRPARILLDPADEIQEALETSLIEVTTGRSSEHGLRLAHLIRGGRGELEGYKNGDVLQKIGRESVRRIETFNEIVRKENPHIFGRSEEVGTTHPRSTYVLKLEVRTADGEREERTYVNLFPDILAAPVY